MSGCWFCSAPKAPVDAQDEKIDPEVQPYGKDSEPERTGTPQIDPEPAKVDEAAHGKAEAEAQKAEPAAPTPEAPAASEAPKQEPQQAEPPKEEKGFPQRMFEKFLGSRPNLAAISKAFADVGDGRRMSIDNTTLDKYVEKHSNVFDKLLKAEKDPRWTHKKSMDGLEVFQFFDDEQGMAAVKGVIEMNCGKQGGLEYILDKMLTPANRPDFDETCMEGRLVEQRLPYYRVSYYRIQTPTPIISNRDVLVLGRLRFEEDGSLLISIESTEHDAAPETPDFVRTSIPAGGYILRPTAKPDVYNVTFVVVANPNGWLPGFVKKAIAWKQSLTLLQFRQKYNL